MYQSLAGSLRSAAMVARLAHQNGQTRPEFARERDHLARSTIGLAG